MEPSTWGKYIWFSMHYIAIGYPSDPGAEDKKNYYEFYNNIHKVLPCSKCATHLQAILKKKPLKLLYLENPDKLFEWTVIIHNEVNKTLNKPLLTLGDAKNIYTKPKDTNLNKSKHNTRIRANNIMSCSYNVYAIILSIVFVTYVYSYPPTQNKN